MFGSPFELHPEKQVYFVVRVLDCFHVDVRNAANNSGVAYLNENTQNRV
jgi:hypothetical protein